MLYLIEIPHQTTTARSPQDRPLRCILSKFHIKPQLARQWLMVPCGCILSKFHIKPQRQPLDDTEVSSCILSKFHIKPQRRGLSKHSVFVVSYRNSTSNHNTRPKFSSVIVLYLIEIPHQTTTLNPAYSTLGGCILSKFHIKPQHDANIEKKN